MKQRPEKILKKAVLVGLVDGDYVFLARKRKRKDGEVKPGEGRYNMYGGGPDPGESLVQAAIREAKEESTVDILAESLKKVAICVFHNKKRNGTPWDCEVHVYLTTQWSGTPKATAEMGKPERFKRWALPIKKMMPADSVWVPDALLGGPIRVEAYYEFGQKKLVKGTGVTIALAKDGLLD